MTLKTKPIKLLAAFLTVCMVLGTVYFPAAVFAENNDQTDEIAPGSEYAAAAALAADTNVQRVVIFNDEKSISEMKTDGNKPASTPNPEVTMESENARMFDQTMKLTIPTFTYSGNSNHGQTYYNMPLDNISTSGYDYVNVWLYSNSSPQDNGEKSTLNLAFNYDKTAEYTGYPIPVEAFEWKLVSIPTSEFKNNSTGSTVLPANLSNIQFGASYTSAKWGGKKWRSNVGPVMIDYIYLSKEAPPSASPTVTDTNIETLKAGEETVPTKLDGSNTVTFTLDRDLVPEAVHEDKVTVTKGGQKLESGFKIEVGDNPKEAKLIFDNELDADTEYKITFGAEAVYDIYGYPNSAYEEISFNTAPAATEPPSPSPEQTEEPSAPPIETEAPSPEPIETPSEAPEPTDTPSAPPIETEAPSPEPIETPPEAPEPTDTPSAPPIETESPSPEPIETPSEVPEPMETPSAAPIETESPSPAPTTAAPTETPTSEPTATPTQTPAAADKDVLSLRKFNEDPVTDVTLSKGTNQYSDSTPSIEMTEEDTRMFNKTFKYTIAKGAYDSGKSYGQSKVSGLLGEEASISTEGYNYVNLWINSKALPKHTNDTDPSTLNIAVNGDDITYALKIDWKDGWKLVSIPTSDFKISDGKAATFPSELNKMEFNTNYTLSGTGNDGKRWKDGGELKIDYIYLSKEAPPSADLKVSDNIKSMNESDGTVREDLDGDNTITFTADRVLLPETLHESKVTVTKNDEPMREGYSVSVDGNNTIKLKFDANLEEDSVYSISLEPGCVYDEYGYTLAEAYDAEFATKGAPVPTAPSETQTPAPTPANTPTETQTPAPTPTMTPTETPTSAPTATPTKAPIPADTDVISLRKFSEETEDGVSLTKGDNQDSDSIPSIGMTDKDVRMFNKTFKYAVAKGAWKNNANYGQSRVHGLLSEEANIQTEGYKYVNLWIYSNALPKDTNGSDPSTLNIAVNGDNITYALPIDWSSGWKLVSVPTTAFKGPNNTDAEFPSDLTKLEFTTNYSLSGTGKDGKRWAVGGEIKIDYIYLSKEAPPSANLIMSDNIGSMTESDGTVREALDGENTITFTADRVLLPETLHANKVTVTKNGQPMRGGYSVSLDADNAIKLKFDESPEENSVYSISLEPGCVYDEYGYTLAQAYNASFATKGAPVPTPAETHTPAPTPTKTPAQTPAPTPTKTPTQTPAPTPTAAAPTETPKPADADVISLRRFSKETEDGVTLSMGNHFPDSAPSIEMTEEDARIFGQTFKYTVARGSWDQTNGNYGQSRVIGLLEDSSGVSAEGCKYLNLWIYSNALPKDTNGNPSTLNITANGDNITYGLPIDWDTGWKLVSVPTTAFRTTGNAVAEFPSDLTKLEFSTNYTLSGTGNDGKRWADGGKIKIDYIYLSKDEPKLGGPKAASDNLDSLNGGRTITVTMDRELIPESLRPEKIIVKKDGELVEGGYKAKADKTKIDLIFDEALDNGEYSVSFLDGAIYDVYGCPTQTGEFTYLGSSLPQNYTGAPIKDMEVSFVFSDNIAMLPKDAVTITDGSGSRVGAFSADNERKRLTVKFTEDLKPGTKYNVELSGNISDNIGQQLGSAASYSFTTEEAGISVGRPVFENAGGAETNSLPSAGEVVNAKVGYSNLSGLTSGIVLKLAQYDSSGAMLEIVEKEASVAAQSSGTAETALTVKPETAFIKAFVTDADGNIIRTDYSALGADNSENQRVFAPEEAPSGILSLGAADVNIDTLDISGTYDGANAVLISITYQDGTSVLDIPIYADADGKFSCSHIFDDDSLSGNYTVRVSVAGGRTKTLQTEYLSAEKRDTLLDLSNNSTTVDKLSVFLKNNQSSLGMSGMSEAKIDGISQTLYEQRPYDSYSDVEAMIKKTEATLDELNSTIWSGMTSFLAENRDMVLYDNPDYAYYSRLSAVTRNVLNQEMQKSLPIESFEQFRKLFSRTVADYKSGAIGSGTTTGGGGGSGGGGFGGGFGGTLGGTLGGGSNSGGTSVVFTPDVINEYVNGTGGASGIDAVFVDLSTSPWAKESIARLYEAGVISPAADNCFRPEDNITRAEFVKMLTVAFGLQLIYENSGFTDAVENEWYQPYLSSAKAAGIIQGYPDGSFGVDEPISRQDMAVTAYRTVTTLNRSLKTAADGAEFLDRADISDYAIEAVDAMRRAGVINGMEDGTFRPLENAARAQAAKVICGLLDALI